MGNSVFKTTLLVVYHNFLVLFVLSFAIGSGYFLVEKIFSYLNDTLNFDLTSFYQLVGIFYQNHFADPPLSVGFTSGFVVTFWIKAVVFLLTLAFIMVVLTKVVNICIIFTFAKPGFKEYCEFLRGTHNIADPNTTAATAHTPKTFNKKEIESKVFKWNIITPTFVTYFIKKSPLRTILSHWFKNFVILSALFVTSIVLLLFFKSLFFALNPNSIFLQLLVVIFFIITFALNFLLYVPALPMVTWYFEARLVDVFNESFRFFKYNWFDLVIFAICYFGFSCIAEFVFHYLKIFTSFLDIGLLGKLLVYAVAIFKYFVLTVFLYLQLYYFVKTVEADETTNVHPSDNYTNEDVEILRKIWLHSIAQNNYIKNNYNMRTVSNEQDEASLATNLNSQVQAHAAQQDFEQVAPGTEPKASSAKVATVSLKNTPRAKGFTASSNSKKSF